MRRDFYYHLIRASWSQVFWLFGVCFAVTNLLFAGLYWLDLSAIRGGSAPGSILEAFFFSVQTMCTIGYGVLSPGTMYGDLIVTVEAAVTTLGLAFAKASRARASVMWSQPLLVSTLHGKRVLMLRVGNARGNEIIDATADMTVVMDEVSAEGHRIRKLHDLPLIRRRSPIFALSWLVMHEINEDSPLASADWSSPADDLVAVIATLVGHDGTYGQTVYARHTYAPEDLRIDHRFVDIISERPDGRLEIDYGSFDHIISDAEARGAMDAYASDLGTARD